MNIDIELEPHIYQYLLALAMEKKISLNLLIEMHFLDLVSKSKKPKT